MRPVKVEFQAFGPYAGKETVDFENLASEGLFLICGKTGIGKTMIIDAMTYALFGKSSGNGRDSFDAMRCTKADPKTPTVVSFEFEQNGDYYRFQRRFEKRTKNFSESQDVSVKDEDGVWKTLFEKATKDNIKKKAEEIIGLTYDQFRQVIVLPQGQFEKLLTSNSSEKEAILTTIFGVDKWQRIADRFYEEAVQRMNEITAVRDRILTGLEDENCESIDDLREKVREMKTELEDREREYADAGYEEKIGKLQEMLEVSGKLLELEANLEKRKNEEIKAIELLPQKEEILGDAQEKLAAHLGSAEEIEKLKEKKITFESRVDDYTSMDTAVSEHEALLKKRKTAEKAMKTAEGRLESSSKALIESESDYKRLSREHEQLMDRYIAGITGELARDLEDGQACPVCGSTDHPNKAKMADDSVSKDDVEDKKKEVDSAYRGVESATEVQKKAREEFDKKKGELDDLDSESKVSEARLGERKKNLIEGIENAEDLRDRIDSIREQITRYEKDRKTLEDSAKEAKEALSLAKEKLKTAKTEREDAEGSLKKARAELEDRQIPKPDEIRNSLDELRKAADEHSTGIGIMKTEVERLEEKEKSLSSESKGLDDRIRLAESNVAFGKKLRGDTGTGLQRYVLGIMFSSVVAEANKMLELVHGGRYRLFRTDDKGKGNKRGLELKVHDRYSDEHEGRFVGTMSGGEKFLAALALSIGMANVARKSGIGIDALFIDEGFGTLDEESIGDAMKVLSTIQRSNGLVGIISHMQILRDNISTKLIVEGGDEGSHITRQVG